MTLYHIARIAGASCPILKMERNAVTNLAKYLVAGTLAVGATFAAVGAQAAVACGPHGCTHYYPHRSQWPVGGAQAGKYYNTAPWGCAMVGGQRTCHHGRDWR
jgi:hypothetical protein